jgi:hypothetical protein
MRFAMAKIGILSFVFTALILTSCATKPRVSADYEDSYNFAALKTFSVKQTKQESKEDLLISPFTLSHIYTLINTELAKRYQATEGEVIPDFYVSYHVVMEEKLDPHSYDELYGFGYWGRGYRYPSAMFYHPYYGYGGGYGGGTRVYNQGSLIVDMVDAKTQQPIWRGVSEKRLNRSLSPQQQRQILASAVLELLAQFPPVK